MSYNLLENMDGSQTNSPSTIKWPGSLPLPVKQSKNNSRKRIDSVDNLIEPSKSRWHYLKMITVEPTMFFYMMAYMLTSVVEQGFFVHKACTVDLGYSEDLCLNLTANKTANKEVQVIVSTFHQNHDIASHVIPIFLALFVGAWSDRRGRKLLLLMGLLGKIWYSSWIVINSVQDTWPLDYVVWTASLPSGLTGADLAIFAACFSYLSDITTPEDRTVRITILDVTYLTTMPIGVALGKYLFRLLDRSFTIMFVINVSLLLVSFVYSMLRLEWATAPQQEPLNICCVKMKNVYYVNDRGNANEGEVTAGETKKKQPNFLLDFFDKQHLIDSIKTVTKKRPNHGRLFLIILIFSLGFYTFQRDEKPMSYLYTNHKFKWTVDSFSDFRTFQSGIYVVGTFLCIPLMGRLLKLSDTTMIFIGTLAHGIARVVFAFAQVPWLFYLGAGIAFVGPVVAPVLRSMASKVVPLKERGKVFAILSVADTTVPLFSGTIYTQVYNATIDDYPSAIYWVTVATQSIVFICALVIRILNGNKSLENCAVDEREGERPK